MNKDKKLLALGDIHGRDSWEDIINSNNPDEILFIWDYFDSKRDISWDFQLQNFRKILELKKRFWKKVILLVWNHEFHYLDAAQRKWPGYNLEWSTDIQKIILKSINKERLQLSKLVGDILFTHAWVTNMWRKDHDIAINNIEKSLNKVLHRRPGILDNDGSPVYVRPPEVLSSPIKYRQVVWHTPSQNVIFHQWGSLIQMDCLWKSGEFLWIKNWKIEVWK